VVWLDGLDIPCPLLRRRLRRERHRKSQQVTRTKAPASPATATTWRRCARRALRRDLADLQLPLRAQPRGAGAAGAHAPLDAWDGVKLRYVNPLTGGWPMPTIGTFMQKLPPASTARAGARPTARSTAWSKATAR
jgi:gentisate 1,2-dioxygenase